MVNMLRTAVSLLVVSGLTQAQFTQAELEELSLMSPQARAELSNFKLAGGALAAGAGLAFLKNYWNRPSPAPTTTYYRPSQHYYSNNRYPTYYSHPSQSQHKYNPHYSPGNTYYIQPYNYNNQQQYPHYNYNNQQQYPQQYNNYKIDPEYNTTELEQRIMEDEGLYAIGIIELPPESRKIKKLLAGGAGLAAGYYLANKFNQYKNSGNTNSYVSSQPSYRPTYIQKYQYQPAVPVVSSPPYQYQPVVSGSTVRIPSSYQYHHTYRPQSTRYHYSSYLG